MSKNRMYETFQEMVDEAAPNMPHGLILDWGQRLERALRYYIVAYHRVHKISMARAIELLEKDARLPPDVIAALHELRRQRNAAAHDSGKVFSSADAVQFASEALRLIGLIADLVPDDLALSSGAARVA
jgi:hypothetical protein